MAVYEAYYGCAREPFSLNPDPSFLYASPSHREALAQLRYVVQQRKGFAVVTGEVGTGKTMLLRSLIETGGPRYRSDTSSTRPAPPARSTRPLRTIST